MAHRIRKAFSANCVRCQGAASDNLRSRLLPNSAIEDQERRPYGAAAGLAMRNGPTLRPSAPRRSRRVGDDPQGGKH